MISKAQRRMPLTAGLTVVFSAFSLVLGCSDSANPVAPSPPSLNVAGTWAVAVDNFWENHSGVLELEQVGLSVTGTLQWDSFDNGLQIDGELDGVVLTLSATWIENGNCWSQYGPVDGRLTVLHNDMSGRLMNFEIPPCDDGLSPAEWNLFGVR